MPMPGFLLMRPYGMASASPQVTGLWRAEGGESLGQLGSLAFLDRRIAIVTDLVSSMLQCSQQIFPYPDGTGVLADRGTLQTPGQP